MSCPGPRALGIIVLLALAPATRAAVNLVGESIARPAAAGSCDDLGFASTLSVRVRNAGADAGTSAFDVLAFEDLDGDGAWTPARDALLGVAADVAPLGAAESRFVAVPVAAMLHARDPVLHAWIDSGADQAESDERDNVATTRGACSRAPAPATFDAVLEWEWTDAPVVTAPMVGDVDADGIPDVVFASGLEAVHCLDGRTGRELWTSGPPHAVSRWVTVAIGELDGAPGLETVTVVTDGGRLVAFHDDGTFWWLSEPLTSPPGVPSGGVTLADLDCDGVPEAIHGKDVVDARTGRLFWTPDPGGTEGTSDGFPGFSTPADVDGDGDLEVIAGPTAWDLDPSTRRGRIAWTQPAVPEGLTAVGQFDSDAAPEIVVVHGGRIWLLEGETGAVRWGEDLPAGGGGCIPLPIRGGAPTIADFDGDGAADIGVAVADWYAVLEGDGSLKWRTPTQDCSSSYTSSTVFDFEGDGTMEVVYQDEVALRVLRGGDGEQIAALSASSLTGMEMVTIADVDGDERAEILSPNNPWRGSAIGIRCWGDRNDAWVSARRIWNQNAYHVDNVGDDGSIPRPPAEAADCEAPSWRTHGTYRLQRRGEGGGAGVALPDLSLAVVSSEPEPAGPCASGHRLVLAIANGGAAAVGRESLGRVHDGDPATGAPELATFTVPDLPSGGWLETIVLVPAATRGPLHVVVDGDGVVTECRESNNACAVPVDVGEWSAPAAVGTVLRATGHGEPAAPLIRGSFDWSGDAGLPRPPGDHYHVLRGTRPDEMVRLRSAEPWSETAWDDLTPRATTLPLCHYLLVLAADACEQEEWR